MAEIDFTLAPVAQALVSGILTGGVYGLLSVGLSFAFGVMRILNFAHGELVMYGMYAGALATSFGVDPLAVLPLSFLITALVGALQYQFVFRHVVGQASLKMLLAAIGCALVLQMAARIAFGPDTRTASSVFSNKYIIAGPLFLPEALIVAFIVAVVAVLAVELVLRRTAWGKAVRAIADDMEAAQVVGIDAAGINFAAFALACGLAGIAGTVLSMYMPVQPSTGFGLMPIILIATVLGGLGSIGGTFIGGICCGVIQQFTGLVWSSAPANVPLFVLLLVFIAFRPAGLFGTRAE